MCKRRIAVPAILACAAFGAPAGAHAATLSPTKDCVADGDGLVLQGAGFSPNGGVQLEGNGQSLRPTHGGPLIADPTGAFGVSVRLPLGTNALRADAFRAVDTAKPENTASAVVKHVRPRVRVTPRDATASAVRRIRASGFTAGTKLYGHRVRGKTVVNYLVGRLSGRCKSLSVRRRLLPRGIRPGTYRLQFDTFRKYRPSRIQRFRYRVRVVPAATRKSAALSLAPRATPEETR